MEVDKPKDEIPIFFMAEIFSIAIAFAILKFTLFSPSGSAGLSILGIAASAVVVMLTNRKFMPRCPNCGQGIYSMVEIYKFPIVIISFAGKHCWGCGAKYKT